MRRWILRRSAGSEERERLEAEKVTAMVALISLGSHLNLSKTIMIDIWMNRIFKDQGVRRVARKLVRRMAG